MARLLSHDQTAKIALLAHQFNEIPLYYESVAAPNAISHYAVDFVCNFIAPQIKFAFGVYTALEVNATLVSKKLCFLFAMFSSWVSRYQSREKN